MTTRTTPDWVERTLDEADRLADRQIAALHARQRVEAMDARLSTLAEEIGVALLSLLFFGTTLFALAFVNV
jgi:hypothetical protein